jgi:hypothetical protein
VGVVLAAAGFASAAGSSQDVLNAIGGLPAHLVVQLDDPIGFAEAQSGEFVVLDRRAHTVYAVDARKTALRKVVQVGFEEGKVLRPGVLSLSRDDIFAVADAPAGNERIQIFALPDGGHLGAMPLVSRMAPRLTVGPLVLNGVGSLHFTGTTFLVNRPETGALLTEYDPTGHVVRQIGTLRPTGFEANRDLHLAHNVGIPLAAADGGYYVVLQTGVPVIHKYAADGRRLFERHVEGPELDPYIQTLPTTWPVREDTRLPLVPPLVRAAAVDPEGRLWVSLVAEVTYVYDARGDKVRTVQFKGASVIAPGSLAFARNRRVLVTPGCYEFRY